MRENLVGWFEIPVTDMERAANFYNSVFDLKIEGQNFVFLHAPLVAGKGDVLASKHYG